MRFRLTPVCRPGHPPYARPLRTHHPPLRRARRARRRVVPRRPRLLPGQHRLAIRRLRRRRAQQVRDHPPVPPVRRQRTGAEPCFIPTPHPPIPDTSAPKLQRCRDTCKQHQTATNGTRFGRGAPSRCSVACERLLREPPNLRPKRRESALAWRHVGWGGLKAERGGFEPPLQTKIRKTV